MAGYAAIRPSIRPATGLSLPIQVIRQGLDIARHKRRASTHGIPFQGIAAKDDLVSRFGHRDKAERVRDSVFPGLGGCLA